MSQVETSDYYYKVCPSCSSKKLQRIGTTDMSDGTWNKEVVVTFNGYLCGNCTRFIPRNREKYIYDRAEIYRDIKKLKNLLDDTRKSYPKD